MTYLLTRIFGRPKFGAQVSIFSESGTMHYVKKVNVKRKKLCLTMQRSYFRYLPVTVCPTRGLLPLPFLTISFVKPIIAFDDVDNLLVMLALTEAIICLSTFPTTRRK
jgi:hypothetical protein